jgi:hypothetical protein
MVFADEHDYTSALHPGARKDNCIIKVPYTLIPAPISLPAGRAIGLSRFRCGKHNWVTFT